MMVSNRWLGIGAWLDKYDPETSNLLRVLKPNFAVVGDGAWNHITKIQSDMGGPDPLIILRFVDADTTWNPSPLVMAIGGVVSAFPGRFAAYGLNEPDVSTAEAREALVKWELEFMKECRNRVPSMKTVCLNLATGNPPGNMVDMLRAMEDLRPIHDASDYVGLHLYHLHVGDGGFMDPTYTAYRYELWPSWFRRDKLLCTEMGIDGVAGERWGWRDLGYEPVTALSTIAETWRHDGILGGAFFHVGTQDQEWDDYLMNEKIARVLAIHNTISEEEGEEIAMEMPKFRMGVKDEAKRLADAGVDVGLALEDEYYFLPSLAIQTTSTGFFLIRKFPDSGFEVQFHPKA